MVTTFLEGPCFKMKERRAGIVIPRRRTPLMVGMRGSSHLIRNERSAIRIILMAI